MSLRCFFKKIKVMVFNFTDNHPFTARLKLNDEKLEIVRISKLLGVVLSDIQIIVKTSWG